MSMEGEFMMRSGKRRVRALGVLVLGCAVVWGPGCKKEAPAAVASLDAGVAPAAVAVRDAAPVAEVRKPLRFSDVTFLSKDDDLKVSYTLTNPGTAQGRGEACLWLHDDKGEVIEALKLGVFSLKGGTSDTFQDAATVARTFWKQARSVRLFTTVGDCKRSPPQATSEVLHVLPTGQPVPPGGPAPRNVVAAQPADFALSNVELNRDEAGTAYSITYTVKNLSGRRASGTACLRAYTGEGCPCHIEETPSGEFSLPPGGSELITDTILFDDEKHWDDVKVLRLFATSKGCANAADATNVGFKVDKPDAFRDPREFIDVAGEPELDPDNPDAVVDVPDELPVEQDEPYSDSPEDTGH
ncbi:hypothetical protein D7X12_07925 [Corallococcus sicarius]|uniref:Uncharacterized protein n=2 Tax=Corallococcus sicarius TaxID=2316726 RepID=A0A3A8P126_9BACT|nr:hypothetical protein D7X12_07925 [Corallococcus sicarius]